MVIPGRTRTAGNGGAGLLRQWVGGRKRNVDHRGYPSAGPGVVRWWRGGNRGRETSTLWAVILLASPDTGQPHAGPSTPASCQIPPPRRVDGTLVRRGECVVP